MASREDIEGWFKDGRKRKKRYMLVCCDTFSYEYYPVYAGASDIDKKISELQKPNEMSKVFEVYDLDADREEQLNEHRVWRVRK